MPVKSCPSISDYIWLDYLLLETDYLFGNSLFLCRSSFTINDVLNILHGLDLPTTISETMTCKCDI